MNHLTLKNLSPLLIQIVLCFLWRILYSLTMYKDIKQMNFSYIVKARHVSINSINCSNLGGHDYFIGGGIAFIFGPKEYLKAC